MGDGEFWYRECELSFPSGLVWGEEIMVIRRRYDKIDMLCIV